MKRCKRFSFNSCPSPVRTRLRVWLPDNSCTFVCACSRGTRGLIAAGNQKPAFFPLDQLYRASLNSLACAGWSLRIHTHLRIQSLCALRVCSRQSEASLPPHFNCSFVAYNLSARARAANYMCLHIEECTSGA